MSKTNVPKIRFKDFTDAWEQQRLNKLIRRPITDGPHETPVFVENGIPFLSVEAIHDGIIDLSKARGMISQKDDKRFKLKYVPEKGDVFFTKAATIGRVAIVKETNFNIWSPIGAIKPNLNNVISEYLFHYLQTNKIINEAIISSNNGSQYNLGMDKIANFLIARPVEIKEQIKVSLLLSNLDNLISLHQRKYEKLKNLKKYFLEKLFPKNDEKFPNLRFKNFTNAWEQCKCFDICNRYDNLRMPIAEGKRIPGSTPYYGANGIQDYVDGYTHNGEFVLVAEDGANDLKNYPVQYVNGEIWVNNHAHVLKSNKMNSTLFLKYLINSADIESVLVGGGRAKLNANILMNLNFTVPKKNEQSKISSLLDSVDKFITLHQRKYFLLFFMKKLIFFKNSKKNFFIIIYA